MGLFGRKIEQSSTDESASIKRAEEEVEILVAELQSKNWVEIWDSLCFTGLNCPSITEKMSTEAKEQFKNAINIAKDTFAADKANIREDLVEDIQKVLDKISKKL